MQQHLLSSGCRGAPLPESQAKMGRGIPDVNRPSWAGTHGCEISGRCSSKGSVAHATALEEGIHGC